jgi:hypothetical protein
VKQTAFFLAIVTALLPNFLSGSAAAADRADVFAVSVPVDATAASATVARETARLDGQRRAYMALFDRLAPGRDRSRIPAPTDALLNDVITGFEVANERRSDVRYLADYTFHFRPAAIEQILRSRGIAFAESASKAVLVLPVIEGSSGPGLWEESNTWRDAWSKAKPPQGLVPLKTPLGDARDMAAINANAAETGNDDGLRKIAKNYGDADVLVTRATIKGKSVNVSSTRFVPGSPGGEQTWVASYNANAGESDTDLLVRAANGTAAQVNDAWKQANLLDYSQAGTLIAVVPTEDLRGWIAVRQRLSTMASIQRTELMSLDRHGATISLRYIGGLTQLRQALAQASLDLTGNDPNWVLQRRGADSSAAQ